MTFEKFSPEKKMKKKMKYSSLKGESRDLELTSKILNWKIIQSISGHRTTIYYKTYEDLK